MSERPPDPLDPSLAALLVAERHAVPSAAALERVWSRVAGAAGHVPTGGGGTGGAVANGTGAWLAAHPIGVGVTMFVLGGAAGAGLHAFLQTRAPPQVIYVERAAPPLASATPALPSAPAPLVASSSSATPTVPAVPRGSARAVASAGASSLPAERALLDDARTALASGDAAGALSRLDDHARRFPQGQLGEEREALAIQALVAEGRGDEARVRAARLRAASPNSLFLPAIEVSLSTIP